MKLFYYDAGADVKSNDACGHNLFPIHSTTLTVTALPICL